ncbi:MAG: hypothetical protein EPO23_13860 [Xanthobacteraceae bacterium]|nr:MAG: hypothetical protein EPO23_13860 [Xanthobacteraceae bacterium]
MRMPFLPAGCLALALLPPLAAAADPLYPAGSRVGLEPAEGLVAAKTFSGFEDSARGVKLLLADLPPGAFAAFEQAAKDQARDRTKDRTKGQTKGSAKAKSGAATTVRPESFATAAGTGYLSRETVAAAAARRWTLIAPAADAAVYVLMEIPDAAAAAYPDDAVRRMLATLTVRDEIPAAEQIEQLPFKMRDLADFRTVRTLIPHSAILLTDGTDDSTPEDAPYIVVSTGTGGPAQADDRGRFANNLLTSIPGLRDSRVVSSEPIRIGGLSGYETRIEGTGATKNTPMVLVQWLRFGAGGFLRIVAGSSKDNWPQAFPRFRAVRDGIETR